MTRSAGRLLFAVSLAVAVLAAPPLAAQTVCERNPAACQ